MKHFLLLLSLVWLAVNPVFSQENTDDKLARERQEQTGTAISIIFDDSGSMNADNKLNQAKAAFAVWLKNVPDDYKLSLITFKDGGKIIIPLGENNRPAVTAAVAGLSAASATPICAALKLARAQIEKRRKSVTPYERHVVLLFTDGEENQDPGGEGAVRQNIGALRAANIEVAGVGFHGQGDYMDGVATRYYSANDAQSLATGLAKIDAEIGDTSDIVVSNAELAQMKISVPAMAQVFPTTPDATPEVVEPAAPVAPKKKFSFGTLIFIVILFLVLRSIFGKKR